METPLSAPIDLFWSGFIAHLVLLSLDPCARIGNLWPLSVTLVIFDELLRNWSPYNAFIRLNILTQYWSGVFFFFSLHRQMTLRRLQRKPKTSPRTTQRGSEWWSSPRARTTLLQLLVGHFYFPIFVRLSYTYFHLSTTRSHPNFGPFWTSLPFT